MKKIVWVALLGTIVAVLGITMHNIKDPEIVGTWKDIDDEYYVVFSSDGTYIESEYGISRTYACANGVLSYYDVAGELYRVNLRKNYGGHITVTFNGKTRVLAPHEGKAVITAWDTSLSGTPIEAYKMLNNLDGKYHIRLFDNGMFRSVCGARELIGKYIITSSEVLYFFDQDGNILERWQPWANGYVSRLMEGSLTYVEVEENPLQIKELLLTGEVYSTDLGLHYAFSDTGEVNITMSGDTTFSFTYTVSTDGLITMLESTGSGISDYLYFDRETGRVFRYVLAADSWLNYLAK